MPGDEMAAGAGDGSRPVASQVGREQVLNALKTAFVQGRLAKDEFDLRIGKVLAAYAELDALTADIPAGLTTAQPSELARESHNKRLIKRGTAAGAGASVVLAGTVVAAGQGLVLGLVVGVVFGAVMTVLLAGLLTLLSRVLDKGSRRPPSRGLPPDASGRTLQRVASSDPAGQPSEISPGPPHTAEAARSSLSRPPLSCLRLLPQWRIANAQERPTIAKPTDLMLSEPRACPLRARSSSHPRHFTATQVRDRLDVAAIAVCSLSAPVTSREESSPGDARWRPSEHTRRSSGPTIR